MTVFLDKLSRLESEKRLVVGAGSGSDLILRESGVELRHACFSEHDGTIYVQDLDSGTGTFINESEVRGRTPVQAGDRVRLGSFEFLFPDRSAATSSSRNLSRTPSSPGEMSLTVVDAVKVLPNGRRILDHVSFHLAAGQFLGILGSSGSGKSTLIKALAGTVELSGGAILVQGDAVGPATLKIDRRIAYLPQDVVIHEALPAGLALNYIARLKEIGATPEDRRQIVQAVLNRVGLQDRMDVPIHRLSGGQRKRVALAAELLGDPQLILLDEATSGLDPSTEEEMMTLFRSLAEEGRTVVCITHHPARLDLCDRLLFLNEGKCVFYGTPAESRRHFAVAKIEDVYAKQQELRAADWELQFQRSESGRRALEQVPTAAAISIATTALAPFSREILQRQTAHLVSRYFRLQMADPKNLLLLLAQAPFIALMIAVTYGNIRYSFAELHAANTKEVIFLLVVSVLWCSGTSSVREIVKELPILQHETRFGVRLWPYILSKFTLLNVLSLIQTFVMLMIVRTCTQLSGDSDFQFVVLMLLGWVGVSLGLAISAVAGTSDRAMTMLPVVLIGQAIFSGGLGRLEGLVRILAMLFSPAYWALDGLRALFSTDLRNATYPGVPGHFQPPILGPGGPLVGDLLALILQALVLLGLTWLTLRHATGQVLFQQSFAGARQILVGVWRWAPLSAK